MRAYLRYKKFCSVIEQLFDICCFILVAILALTVIIGVLFRNIGVPVVWLGELGTFSTIWVTFLGLGLAYRHKMHPNVDLLMHFFKPLWKRYFEMAWDVIAAGIVMLIMISAVGFMQYLKMNGHTSGELGWPIFYVYLIPCIGLSSVIFFAIESLWAAVMDLRKTKKESIV